MAVATHAPKERALAIETFARDLSKLRDSAGKPSFRVMAARSGAISHTTLHEAAQGNRLPSWETTVEFVKACGANPEDYHVPWQRAEQVVTSRTEARREAGLPRSDEAARQPEPAGPHQGMRRGGWYVGLGAVALAAVAVGSWVIWSPPDQTQSQPQSQSQSLENPAPSASECPISQANPPPAPPRTDGDHAVFVSDVTLPDCARVRPGETVVKTWRFKNAGSVPWEGYTLHRIDPQGRQECQTVPDVPIPQTAPGEMVDVSTPVTVPDTTGFCFVRFKMRDASNADAFPAGRPVNFQVIIQPEASAP